MTSGAWVRRWPTGQRKTIYFCMLVLGAGTFVMMVYGQKIWADYWSQMPGHPAEFGDFFALWSYGKIAATHSASALYGSALEALQAGLGQRAGAQNPFPYPPIAILLFRPLAWLPYDLGYVVWTAGTLALFVWAVVATCSRLVLPVVGTIVAPVTTACIAAGQTGLLTAALLVAGCRLAGERPILGGALIGLLAYKPQMALLVPVAFAAAGYWRALASACVTAMVLALVATAVYGAEIWPEWVAMLPGYVDQVDRASIRITLKPTIMANLQSAGVGLTAATIIQGLVALGVAVSVWRCFRHNAGRLATAALLVGTALASPHLFIYDLPIIAAAMVLLIQQRMDSDPVFSLGEIVILIAGFAFPVAMMLEPDRFAVPVSAVPLLLLFGLILRDAHRVTGAR